MADMRLEMLTRGLQAGFAGESTRERSARGGFEFESSHYTDSEGRYHDEWIADRVGGGQEIVEIDGVCFTRLYAGGTISLPELEAMGITKKDVIGYLISKIRQVGAATRLLEECQVEDGDWSYHYHALDQEAAIPLFTAREEINFKEQLVFVHNFLLCPVE